MQDIFHTQPDYVKNSTKNQKLSISLRQDGFSFVIHATEQEKIAALAYQTIESGMDEKEYAKELLQFLQQDLLQQDFLTVQIIFVTPKITIIPVSVFDTAHLKLLFTLNHEIAETEEIHYYRQKNSESYLLYAIPEFIANICTNAFNSKILFIPQAAPFIESSILLNKLSQNKTVFVSLESTFFDILILEGQKITLYNTFRFSNVNDYIYFIMNIYEQLQLHPLHNKIILSGKISKSSSYYESTSMFIKQVDIVEPFPSQKQFQHFPFEHVSYPLFSNLCNISLCE